MFPKNSMLFNEEFGGLFGLKIVAENKFLLYILFGEKPCNIYLILHCGALM